MGDDQKIITISKAADILNCSEDRVHELADQSLIRRHHEGDQCYVFSSDIADIRRLDIAGEMRPGEMVRRILILEQQVRRLQASMQLMYEVQELAASRFGNMSDVDLVKLYENITMLAQEDLNVQMIDEIAELMMQITEVEIDRLNELQNTSNTWLPFVQLCHRMTRQIVSDPALATSLPHQRANAKLSMAKKNVMTIATFFIERAGVLGPSRELLARAAAIDIEAFDIIARKVKREGKLKLVK